MGSHRAETAPTGPKTGPHGAKAGPQGAKTGQDGPRREGGNLVDDSRPRRATAATLSSATALGE